MPRKQLADKCIHILKVIPETELERGTGKGSEMQEHDRDGAILDAAAVVVVVVIVPKP